jgi:hypothetical protein
MVRTLASALLIASFLSVGAVDLAAQNIAQGKSVTATGSFGTGGDGWGNPEPAPLSSVTDGSFLPTGTQWNLGTVWWNTTNNPASLVINLGGLYRIFGFAVQADDNDAYNLEYRAGPGDEWTLAWFIPAVGGWGMQTRNTTLGSEIFARELRFTAVEAIGDQYRSVSEIQAFGVEASVVPEPISMVLLGTGLAGGGELRRRRKQVIA